MADFLSLLESCKIAYKNDVLLSSVSGFKIGGKAKYYVMPVTSSQVVLTIKAAKDFKIPFKIIGNATNLLFSDKGYKGAIISLKKIRNFEFKGDKSVYCDCGLSLPKLSEEAAKRGLSGLEFACGIPGSVGGAAYMNAGAYGGQISDVLSECHLYDFDKGELLILNNGQMDFEYRKSILTKNKNFVCLGVKFSLKSDSEENIRERMRENIQKRKDTQPVFMPSAGSYFKRPEGNFAAKLIDECGLKGYTVGGACVSPVHAGFIVNKGGATSDDVLELAKYVAQKVYLETGVKLEPEVESVSCEED